MDVDSGPPAALGRLPLHDIAAVPRHDELTQGGDLRADDRISPRLYPGYESQSREFLSCPCRHLRFERNTEVEGSNIEGELVGAADGVAVMRLEPGEQRCRATALDPSTAALRVPITNQSLAGRGSLGLRRVDVCQAPLERPDKAPAGQFIERVRDLLGFCSQTLGQKCRLLENVVTHQ